MTLGQIISLILTLTIWIPTLGFVYSYLLYRAYKYGEKKDKIIMTILCVTCFILGVGLMLWHGIFGVYL